MSDKDKPGVARVESSPPPPPPPDEAEFAERGDDIVEVSNTVPRPKPKPRPPNKGE